MHMICLSVPFSPQQSSQNFCIFRVKKNYRTFFGVPSAWPLPAATAITIKVYRGVQGDTIVQGLGGRCPQQIINYYITTNQLYNSKFNLRLASSVIQTPGVKIKTRLNCKGCQVVPYENGYDRVDPKTFLPRPLTIWLRHWCG